MTELTPTAYTVELNEPLFFSSSQRRSIKTSKYIAATATMHALGYRFGELEKHYIQLGDRTTNPDYSHLSNIGIICSDMSPESIERERTFRSTSYTSERNFFARSGSESGENDVTNYFNLEGISHSTGFPKIAGVSNAGWSEVRNFAGIAPGSTFSIVIWSNDTKLPESFRLRMGINRTGHMTLKKTSIPDTVTLNKFMMENTFDAEQDVLGEAFEKSKKFKRGGNQQLQHFVGVPFKTADNIISQIYDGTRD